MNVRQLLEELADAEDDTEVILEVPPNCWYHIDHGSQEGSEATQLVILTARCTPKSCTDAEIATHHAAGHTA